MGVFDQIDPAALFWLSVFGAVCIFTVKIAFDWWFYAGKLQNQLFRERMEIEKIAADADWKRWRAEAVKIRVRKSYQRALPYQAETAPGGGVHHDTTPTPARAGQGRAGHGDGSYSLSDGFYCDDPEDFTDEDITEMHNSGMSPTKIAEKVHGQKGGWQLKNIKARLLGA